MGNKINIYLNKSKIPNRENRKPNNCITEKYLQNDKHIDKRKKILLVIMLTLLHLGKNAHCWAQSLQEN